MEKSNAENDGKQARKVRTIEEEIAAATEKLKRLQEKQREAQRKDRERNQRAVLELLRTEHLDTVPAEKWQAVLPKIKELLG